MATDNYLDFVLRQTSKRGDSFFTGAKTVATDGLGQFSSVAHLAMQAQYVNESASNVSHLPAVNSRINS